MYKSAQILEKIIKMKTYKYRIYPTKEQQEIMGNILQDCCWTHNKGIETKTNLWKEKQERISKFDLYKKIPNWRNERTSLGNVRVTVLRDSLERVDLAFQHFFRRCKTGETPGYPRFKHLERYDSFTYTCGTGFKILNDRYISLSGIGDVRMVYHRPIHGKAKTCNVNRSRSGKWFVSISAQLGQELNDCHLTKGRSTATEGILTQIKPRFTEENGIFIEIDYLDKKEEIQSPLFFEEGLQKISYLVNQMNQFKKGEGDFDKYKKLLEIAHERIAFRRKDFIHKLSRAIVDAYPGIRAMNVPISNVLITKDKVENPSRPNESVDWNRRILDSSWNMLLNCLKYKAIEAGKIFEQEEKEKRIKSKRKKKELAGASA